MEERMTFHLDKEQELPNVPRRMEQIKRHEEAFWARWEQDGFPLLCPLKKWTQAERNLQVGDIGLLKYEQRVSKDKFRLCKVEEVKPDEHGRVRTVIVAVRDRRKAVRELREVCRSGLVRMEVAVQRIVVILPAEEAWGNPRAE